MIKLGHFNNMLFFYDLKATKAKVILFIFTWFPIASPINTITQA